jgi:hypothetical protein
MKERWERPAFQEVGINGECTAYSGRDTAPEGDALSRSTGARSPVDRTGLAGTERTPGQDE